MTHFPHVRAERLIALGRACLAAFALVGVILDSTDPEAFAQDTLWLLAVYSAYATALWALTARDVAITGRASLATHCVDMLVAMSLTLLTEGSGSPFFLFFTFLLVCATIRWGDRGTWWTAVAVMTTYVAVGAASSARLLSDADFEVNRFVVRLGSLVVMTMLLVALGRYQERLYRELRHAARDAAVAEERLRVGRDLHDGVLQALTGCRLGIAATAAAAASTAEWPLALELQTLERRLATEQQELRRFIQDLRDVGAETSTATPLRDLCARVEQQWGIAVSLAVDADDAIPSALMPPVLLMCHEAIANAARHGSATAVAIDVRRLDDDGVVVTVRDNGCGFSFEGRRDARQLAAMQAGPRSIRERAEGLGGTVSVESTPVGATVEIALPIAPEAVCG